MGENHKVVMNTKESINFVIRSQESQVSLISLCIRAIIFQFSSQHVFTFLAPMYYTYELSKERNANTDDGIKIERIGGILPYVSYEESKRIYNKVQNDVSAVIDAVSSSNRCNQPLCDGEDRSFTS